jgi:hypothetical protein
MRFRIWARAILGAPLFGGLTALAQYVVPATPALYNPIALAEMIGGRLPRAAHAGQNRSPPSVVRPSPRERR